MAYKIIIHAEGPIDETKVKPEVAKAIEDEIKKLSPYAEVTVSFRKEAEPT